MKKTLLKYLGVAALAFAVSSTASAALINGVLLIGGSATLNTGDAETASSVTNWNFAVVAAGSTGDFAGIAPGTAVTLVAPWTFNSGAVANFWRVGQFEFDLTSSWITNPNLSDGKTGADGVGILYRVIDDVRYDATPGTWSFSSQNPGTSANIFSFSASGATVPDGGTTAALLGAALVGLSLLARRRAA